jgi:RimJ/RimL family protein N-acetyltransferase
VNPFTLSAGPVVLDSPAPADAERVYEYCQDPLFEKYLTVPWPYSRLDASYFVGTFVPDGWTSGRELTWALRSAPGQPLLGVVGIRLEGAGQANLGFWLGAPHRGRGLMPAAVTAVADWAFAAGGIRLLAWECVLGNRSSLAVARKVGFHYIGTGPADIPARDKSRPGSWKGILRVGDDRVPKAGWPA